MSLLVILISIVKECASEFNLWSHPLKMEELNMHIWDATFWEFTNNKNATETAKKICRVNDQGVITDYQVSNWFSKLLYGNTWSRGKPRSG